MIKAESLSSEWISDKRKKLRKDPTIVKGMIYAFYLLECLRQEVGSSNLPSSANDNKIQVG
jgi:hypothetical protein